MFLNDTFYIEIDQRGGYYVYTYDSDSDDDENRQRKMARDNIVTLDAKPLYFKDEWKITNREKIQYYKKYIHHKQFGCSICQRGFHLGDRRETESDSVPLFQWDDIESINKTKSLIET